MVRLPWGPTAQSRVKIGAVEIGYGVLGIAADRFRCAANLRKVFFTQMLPIGRLAFESGADVGEGGSR
jgi:hypothetical protein